MATVVPPPPSQRDSAFTDSRSMLAYIVSRSQSLGVDPQAALAVAHHEGITLPAEVGDNGTSFGPWQLHIGGALPSSVAAKGSAYANQWANSPAGVDYALQRIASVSRGQRGAAAITSIVSRFERPKDIPGEISRSIATYPTALQGWSGGGGGGVTGAISGAVSGVGGAIRTGVDASIPGINLIPNPGDVIGGVKSTAEFLGHLSDPHYILRGLQVIAGGVLVLVGVVLLARQVGLAFAQSDTGRAVTGAAEAVATRGASKAVKAPAAAKRGKQVARASGPERTSARDKVNRARNQRRRDQEEARRRRELGEKYGDVPF